VVRLEDNSELYDLFSLQPRNLLPSLCLVAGNDLLRAIPLVFWALNLVPWIHPTSSLFLDESAIPQLGGKRYLVFKLWGASGA